MNVSRRLPLVSLLLVALAWGCSEPVVEPYDPTPVGDELPGVIEALRAGRPEAALEVLRARRDAGDWPEGADHFEGVALVDAGRLTEATEVLARELSLHPGNGLAHLLRAEALVGLGRAAEAAPHVESARSLRPDLGYVELVAARAAMALDQDIDAAKAFIAFLETDRTSPRAGEAHHGLSQIARRQGDARVADAHQTTSDRIENAHRYLASFQARLNEDPGDAEAALGAGMAWLDLFREVFEDGALLGQSEAAFRTCLQHDPTNVRALYNLGYVRLMAGAPEDALACWDQTLAIEPTHVGALLNGGRLLVDQGRTEEALPRLEQALATATAADDRDGRRRAHLELARAWEAAGQPEEAAGHRELAETLSAG